VPPEPSASAREKPPELAEEELKEPTSSAEEEPEELASPVSEHPEISIPNKHSKTLAGDGDGNTTDAALAALRRAAKAGVVVVRSSRVDSGIVDRNVEVNDDGLGFITTMELSPQKARILLMLGLTRTKDHKELQELFAEY